MNIDTGQYTINLSAAGRTDTVLSGDDLAALKAGARSLMKPGMVAEVWDNLSDDSEPFEFWYEPKGGSHADPC